MRGHPSGFFTPERRAMGRLFRLQETCLQAMGHTGGHENSIPDGKLSLKHIVSLAYVVSAQYPLISYIVYNIEDMEKVTACLSVVFTNMLTVIKITTFLAYKQDFWRMIQRFREMHQQCK